jgi:hypothetical protein
MSGNVGGSRSMFATPRTSNIEFNAFEASGPRTVDVLRYCGRIGRFLVCGSSRVDSHRRPARHWTRSQARSYCGKLRQGRCREDGQMQLAICDSAMMQSRPVVGIDFSSVPTCYIQRGLFCYAQHIDKSTSLGIISCPVC